jgi:hypothetical protein
VDNHFDGYGHYGRYRPFKHDISISLIVDEWQFRSSMLGDPFIILFNR